MRWKDAFIEQKIYVTISNARKINFQNSIDKTITYHWPKKKWDAVIIKSKWPLFSFMRDV